jgi:MFS transporter, ACS family, D-galactonate transporter
LTYEYVGKRQTQTMGEGAMTGQHPQKGAWLIVALLFLFMLINFVDKAVLGLAAVPIMKELELTPSQFGFVASSFFFLFSISAVITGFIVNRMPTRWALLVMALVWVLAQFPMIGTVGLGTLVACRVLLGAGEGPAYPVALHSAYKWFPNEYRTLPTSIIAQGAAVGVVLALPLLNWIIIHYSWHWAFGMLGIVGLAWVLLWFVLGTEGEIVETVAETTGRRIERVPYAQLLFNATTLSCWAVGFAAYWGLSLLVAWSTPYFIKGLGYSQYAAGYLSTMPWAAGVIIVIGSGWASQRMLAHGASTRWARGVFSGLAVVVGGLALIVMPHLESDILKIAMLVIGLSLPSVIYVMGHAMLSEFTPVPQRGAMLAITNSVWTLAGLLAPYLMGQVIEGAATAAEGYQQGFVLCGVVTLIGGLIGLVFLRPGTEVSRFAPRHGSVLAPAG